MSIIKRKAGSEDIVKSVLEFDEVPTEGSINLVESGSVAGAIAKGIKIAIFECRDNGSDQNFFTGPTYAELEASRTAGKTIVLLVHYGFDIVVDRYFEMTNYSFGRGAFTYQFTEANGGRVMQFSGTVGDVDHHAWSKASAYDSSLSSISTNAVQNKTLYALIGSIKNGEALTDAAYVNVPNNAISTLATAQSTLTLNVDVGATEVPNFAVEVTPSVDLTLTVTKTVGNTTITLNPSVAGGNTLTAGKLYQVTCVGSCWTLAEFAMPS